MTTIHDLPPEILYRILELAAGFESGYWRKLLLQPTSAVARAWRHPSQELLLSDVTLSAIYPHRTIGFAARLQDYTLVEMRRLTLDRFFAEDVELATKGIGRLGSLRIEGDHAPFPALALSPRILGGLRSLELWQEIAGVFQPPPNQPITLKHLSLTAEYSLPESALEALLASAPNLTHLDLHCGGATYNHSWLQRHNPLTILGPRLRHLGLHNPPPPPQVDSQAGLSFSLSAALPTCTSLVSLEVSSVTEEQLFDIFRLLPSQLELLETTMVRMTEEGHGFLVKATALPALSSLKMWRILGFNEIVDGKEPWVVLSRARGIDVRDERRFFTDRCYD
ncbi:hypothetical protein BCR35DRAFT_99212 [Leucosporidium creatinivorum]|uniref:F-box domain-containing protein n=1 Tax=Leucosporidium creatinivorum TaxID=106004 RepID=A0A1Y2F4S5_9BASI|nr:hypothetical protein BCR35DRAFT_99212 [Leucosporidium creatinivorum]